MYFYINIFYIYGTSEWFIIQFVNSGVFENSQTHSNTLRLLLVVFLLGVFFKLGITPFHLFKIEVYKGLPFLSIFFYTTYYFVVFFIFFFKINTTLQKITAENSFSVDTLKLNSNGVFVGFYILLITYLYLNTYLLRGKNEVV